MKKHYPVSKRHLVKDYKKYKPKENRYYFESNAQVLESIQHWGHIRQLLNLEYDLILGNKIMLTYKNSTKYEVTDILFEYLIIRAITFLEICLKFCCNIYVKKFPDRAKQLLTTDDEKRESFCQ